jgi:hypothetical protein
LEALEKCPVVIVFKGGGCPAKYEQWCAQEQRVFIDEDEGDAKKGCSP